MKYLLIQLSGGFFVKENKMHPKIAKRIKELRERFMLVQRFINIDKVDVSDDYKKINYAYFKIVDQLMRSSDLSLEKGYFVSAVALTRTILELHIKSFYIEFIEKPKKSDILDFLQEKEKFPTFVKMAAELDAYKAEDGNNFGGTFGQFTKVQLGSYNKFSLFTHGKGDLLKFFFDKPFVGFSTDTKVELLQNITYYYSTLSLLFFHVQGMEKAIIALLSAIIESEDYQNEMQGEA